MIKINNLLTIIKNATKPTLHPTIQTSTLKAQLIQTYKAIDDHQTFSSTIDWLQTNQTPPNQYQFVKTLLPAYCPINLTTYYLQTLWKVLRNKQNQFDKYTLFSIGHNLYQTIYWDRSEIEDNEIDYLNHLGRQTFTTYLLHYPLMQHHFDSKFHLRMLRIASFLKVYHYQLMDYIKVSIQLYQTRYTLNDLLLCLIYLADGRTFPYEFFYRHKSKWIQILQNTDKYSKKRIESIIRFTSLLSKERFIHCQQIISKLEQLLYDSLPAMDISSLIRVLYYYSRTKYGKSIHFITSVISKIYPHLTNLYLKQYGMLIKAISNLNYSNEALVSQLKIIDYELFVGCLRANSTQLGPYYKLILQQIDTQINQYSPQSNIY